MTRIRKIAAAPLFAATMALALGSCGTDIPRDYRTADALPAITPDYSGVTVPCNIAPLNFRIGEDGDNYVTRFHTRADSVGFIVGGRSLDIPAGKWHDLIGQAAGDTVYIDVFVENNDRWTKYATIRNAVADSIDRYISYRLIEPSYISFETMAICQRDLESFDEREIYNSQMLSTEDEGQCVNCHSYQNYNRDGNMQMHLRVRLGGTLIAHDGELKKINLKTPQTVSSGVYPSWHPSEPLIAYSVNTTTQSFHTRDINKVEVQDAKSDLILYDVESDRISMIANDSTELETFPYWHPDGRSLWYVSASVPPMTAAEMRDYQNSSYEEFKYDIYRKPFDVATRKFGAADTIFRASECGMSATFPRPSPDGRYLLFTMGSFGTFHIWHRDSDLYLMEIATGDVRPLDELNSDNVESYHSWSSNGRWIIFSSRRDDGSYTRLYIAWFGPDGKAAKPFRLPQATPEADDELMKSYNIPEFMIRPVTLSKKRMVETIKRDPVNVAVAD